MIRVLVVEDSPTVREFLLQILCSDADIEIAGTAETGEEALDVVARARPDVITMDLHMPRMNGFDATRRIMESHPTPIVIVSGTVDITETAQAFRAIEAGALAVLQRPQGTGHPEYEKTAAELVRTVKLMSEVKVVRRWPRSRPLAVPPDVSACTEFRREVAPTQISLVAIGASTGGPPVLQTILAALPGDFSLPVLIVQHIAPGFVQGFADWLAQSSSLPVQIPVQGQPVLPGHVYIAPDGYHMAVGPQGQIHLNTDGPENGLRPSVSHLFRSVARSYGARSVGVLLTGMGKDGAWELKLMKEQGAVTVVQDKETSVVHGMPGEAIKVGGATYVLPPEKIGMALTSLANGSGNDRESETSNAGSDARETGNIFLDRVFTGKQ
jgi:two-component system, chemotaxis family, protein-glutamate methylesterase/glutaminase